MDGNIENVENFIASILSVSKLKKNTSNSILHETLRNQVFEIDNELKR